MANPVRLRTRLAAASGGLLLAWSCGGGGSTPTTPSTTTPPSNSTSACSAIGGTPFQGLAILYGTICTAPNSPVVIVRLLDQTGARYGMCSGTVIAKRAVLTAAHCLASPTAAVTVFQASGDTVAASSFAAIPSYHGVNDPATIDLGVVLTAQDLAPAPVPLLASRDPRVGEQAVIAGWGQSETSAGTGNLRAGMAAVTGVTGTAIQTTFTVGTGSGVCYGDSGGPFLLSEGGTWALAGVTSAFSGNSCGASTNSFTNLRNAEASAFVFNTVPSAGRK